MISFSSDRRTCLVLKPHPVPLNAWVFQSYALAAHDESVHFCSRYIRPGSHIDYALHRTARLTRNGYTQLHEFKAPSWPSHTSQNSHKPTSTHSHHSQITYLITTPPLLHISFPPPQSSHDPSQPAHIRLLNRYTNWGTRHTSSRSIEKLDADIALICGYLNC